jgi:hypothetical protein
MAGILVSKVVTPNPAGKGPPTISSKEQTPHPRVAISEAQLEGKSGDPGKPNMGEVARLLGLIQDNSIGATQTTRTDPLSVKAIIKGVQMTNGQYSIVQHGLGTQWAYYFSVNAQPGSDPFMAVPAQFNTTNWPKSYPQNQYLVLFSSSTGVYDIAICPGTPA